MKTLSKISLATLLTLCFFCNRTHAQIEEGPRAQNVYAELLGPGLLFSLNYDTRFGKARNGWGGRAGAGYVSADDNSILTLPVQVNYLLGKKGKYFEVGLGATFISTNGSNKEDDFFVFDDVNTTIGTMTFGYRYQPVDGGFNFRASLNPVFNKNNFIPYYFGLSFGYTF
ncbi:hypothetical protein [Mucilaginibacter terrae]|uniref:Outer membrane protein beta-barrel domain-containing protein n=1 Tax=Mucilaginibacter terrae TaxID=1955052 RepID=A0ABU3GYK4_9SPHI|nr:hypothetical protein [Mucilaginibacter terrae]MDT3404850.1 hypothetical protein [Mucilaginibacter terrae]